MILLINSPLFREKQINKDADLLPPIGLGYIATQLKAKQIQVEIYDAVFQNATIDEIIEVINHKAPSFLGINIFSTNYEIVKELVEAVKISLHVIIGGLATKELYREIIEWDSSNNIDIVIGDGELITCDIVNNSVRETPFVTIGDRRVFKILPSSEYFVSQISNVVLDRRFFFNEPVTNHFGEIEANMITSRGCCNNCTFCAAARSMNAEFPLRERSTESIKYELMQIRKDFPTVKSIRILDDLFLKSEKEIKKAITIFSGSGYLWRSMAHANVFNRLSQKDVHNLHDSGCRELFIGIESGSLRILQEIKKTSSKEQVINNLKKIFTAKIDVKGYFIYGFPGETESDMEMTLDFATQLSNLAKSHDGVFRTSVFQFRPYHGSEIYGSLIQSTMVHSLSLSPNQTLNGLIGRSLFNFSCGNFSEVCLEKIHDYICRTNKLIGIGA